jgi:hypothetical protein
VRAAGAIDLRQGVVELTVGNGGLVDGCVIPAVRRGGKLPARFALLAGALPFLTRLLQFGQQFRHRVVFLPLLGTQFLQILPHPSEEGGARGGVVNLLEPGQLLPGLLFRQNALQRLPRQIELLRLDVGVGQFASRHFKSRRDCQRLLEIRNRLRMTPLEHVRVADVMQQLRVARIGPQGQGVMSFRPGEVLGQVRDHRQSVVRHRVLGVHPQHLFKVGAGFHQPRRFLAVFRERLVPQSEMVFDRACADQRLRRG